jgi:hypothetical protein
MAKFTDEARRRLATGWDPRVCTLREYAHRNGVSERALRGWRARLRHQEAAVDALQGAVESVRAALGAEPALGPVEYMTETTGESANVPAVPLPAAMPTEPMVPARRALATEPAEVRTKRRANFFSEFM